MCSATEKNKNISFPDIYIKLEKECSISKEQWTVCRTDVYDENVCLRDMNAKIKVRGNSSALTPEKPYKIKFDQKINLLGLHKKKQFKRWVLLKTGWYLCNDYLGLKLGKEIFGNSKFKYYVSDCAFINVFINNEYMGLYLLCEQNQIGKGRIDVTKKGNLPAKTGYLLELDNYAWQDTSSEDDFKKPYWKGKKYFHFSCDYFYNDSKCELTDINNETRLIPFHDFTIKKKNITFEQADFVTDYYHKVWYICFCAIEKQRYYGFDNNFELIELTDPNISSYEVCNRIIDIESLCNMFILKELVRDNDVGIGSFYMAIDFNAKKNQKYEKLTFECPWDFNWAFCPIETDLDGGQYWKGKIQYFAGAWQSPYVCEGTEDRSNIWFILFNKTEWFRKLVSKRIKEINTNKLLELIEETEKYINGIYTESGYQDIFNFTRERIRLLASLF